MICALSPVALLTQRSKILLHRQATIGERHYVVEVKNGPWIHSGRSTAQKTPKPIACQHPKSYLERDRPIPLRRNFDARLNRGLGLADTELGSTRELDGNVSGDESRAGIHPTAETLFVGGVRVRGVRRLPL
jgi:hypothetical protein